MQTCRKMNFLASKSAETFQKSLLTFHLMNIVHFDIKPDNLMWSDHFKREVFIDFGLSEIIDGGPGFKYLIDFRGSPNYCLPEMTELLSSLSKRYIDVYYNDVHCLKQTLKIFISNILEESLEQENNYFLYLTLKGNNVDDSREQRKMSCSVIGQDQLTFMSYWLQITHLKIFIYQRDIENIDRIYQSQKSMFAKEEILSFIQKNCEKYYLKDFYHRYISETTKESIENGWIEDWSKSVYLKSSSLPEEKQQLQNLQNTFEGSYTALKGCTNVSSFDLENFSLEQLESVLFADSVEDIQVYFYCFESYISFINNRLRISVSKKLLCCEHFAKLLMSVWKVPRVGQAVAEEAIILEYLSEICLFVLSYYVQSTATVTTKTAVDNSKRLQLILNLFEHIFFFALLETKSVLSFLSEIYSLPLWSQLQKLHIIIAITNKSHWNNIPLFSTKAHKSSEVKQWYRSRLKELGRQNLQAKCRYIYELFTQSDQMKSNIKSIQQDGQFKDLPQIFQMQFLISKLEDEFFLKSGYPIIKITQFISQIFPRSQKERILVLYQNFFIIFNIGYANLQQSLSVCEIFKINLQSDYLYKRLIFYRIVLIEKLLKIEEKMVQIAFLTNLVKLQNINFYIQVIFRELSYIIQKIRMIPITKRPSINGYNELVQSLQNVQFRLNFKEQLSGQLHQKFHIYQCKQYVYVYFKIKIYSSFLQDNDNLSYEKEIQQMQISAQKIQCKACRARLIYQFIRVRIQQAVLSGINSVEKLHKVWNSFLEFKNHNKQFIIEYSQNKIYLSVIGKLVLLKSCDQRLLSIIYQYYVFSKENMLRENLMEPLQIKNFITLSLITVLQFEGFQAMIQYLKATLIYIHNTENVFTLCSMIVSYTNFFYQPKIEPFPQLIQSILCSLRGLEKQQIYVAALYFSYVQTIKSVQEIYYYLKKIFHLICFMPSKIIAYFQTVIYLKLIFVNKQICAKIIASSFCSHQNQNQAKLRRKMISIKIRALKLLYRHHNDNRFINIKKQKQPKVNIKLKMLRKKAKQFGSYKYQDHLQEVNVVVLAK